VNIYHPDLIGRVTGDLPIDGSENHGTHVAGIIGAKSNNNLGISGVNWISPVISKRIMDREEGGGFSEQQAMQKLQDAIYEGADIINNSWKNSEVMYGLGAVFANAYMLNKVCVACMGNDNNNYVINYPAGYTGMIAVGNIMQNGYISGTSTFGNHIDVCAPGNQIKSTFYEGYDIKSGTSMSSAMVSGEASLLLSFDYSLYNADIENIIKISADRTCEMISNNQYWSSKYGTGRINMKRALDLLSSTYNLTGIIQSGSSPFGNSGWELQEFIGVPGLDNGLYRARRYDVRKTINFAYKPITPFAWGRGIGSNGLSGANPNFGVNFCEVMNVTNNSATVRTFVYEVMDLNNNPIGWFPTNQYNATFHIAILSEPCYVPQISNITSNPQILYPNSSMTFTAYFSQGDCCNLSCNWYIENAPSGYNFNLTTSGQNNRVCTITCTQNKNNNNNSNMIPSFTIYCHAINNCGENTMGKGIIFMANPGCPWVFVQEQDTSYKADNNVLHRSQFPENAGKDIYDKYVLNVKPGLFDNKINLNLMEAGTDSSLFNMVKLYAVDHPVGTKIGVTEDNNIILFDSSLVQSTNEATLYDSLQNPLNITDDIQFHYQSRNHVFGDTLYRINALYKENGRRNLGIIAEMQNDWNGITPIGNTKTDNAGFLIANTLYGDFQTNFARRENKSIVVMPVKGNYKNNSISEINLYWYKNFYIRYVALTSLSSGGNFTVTELPLLEAIHSSYGMVTNQLLSVDNSYSYINPNSYITLKFQYVLVPSNYSVRDYVLECNGRVYAPGSKIKLQPTNPLTQNNTLKTKLNFNYPNPFNPITKINYSITNKDLVTIKIFDVLGREVMSLVNEVKQPGEYIVDFDGTNLSSGIYFYKLEAGTFSDVKRMMLIK